MKGFKALAVVCLAPMILLPASGSVGNQAPNEAPTGFDDQTNGMVNQAQFMLDMGTFDE